MQDAPRLYINSSLSRFVQGDEVPLESDQARYLGTVLRLGVGAAVRVFNARDGEWQAALAAIRKDRGALRLEAQTRPPAPRRPITLVFSPLKRDATDLVIRMGTELGVTRFQPVTMHRTNTHRLNYERLSAIAMEASEQCERLDVPEIVEMQALDLVMAQWPREQPLFAAVERLTPDAPDVPLPPMSGGYGLLIGPEGGFSPEEKSRISEKWPIRSFSLGSLVFRADTAACAGLAVLAAMCSSSMSLEI